MIEFLKIQHRLKRITEAQLSGLVADGKITEDEYLYITQQLEIVQQLNSVNGVVYFRGVDFDDRVSKNTIQTKKNHRSTIKRIGSRRENNSNQRMEDF